MAEYDTNAAPFCSGAPVTVIYHGTPLTPRAALLAVLPGRAGCVSFHHPADIEAAASVCSGLMLDNGAFSFWMAARKKGLEACEAARDWQPYYAWAERWLATPASWAVVPDAIAMPSQVNDGLLNEWPLGKQQAAPVWHMDGPISRLLRLCEQGWERVCLGWVGESAADNVVGSPAYRRRMDEVSRELGNQWPRLHMLRGVAVARDYPFRFRRQQQPSAEWVAV
jgi:hypothetical protein